MKKNKMMRLASFLLIAVLLTTSIISGTFAKYVTEGSATDTARVAKFGVVIDASGSLFSNSYVNAAGGNTPATSGTLTVSAAENVVAPGTKCSNDGLKLSITGTPEVNVKVTFAIADDSNDVFLKAGNGLPDMTTSSTTDTFNLTADYNPIKYTLKKGGEAVSGANGVSLSELKTFLATYTDNVAAGTDLGAAANTYTLTWEWPFVAAGNDNNAVKLQNQCDTLLGDLVANTTLTPNLPSGYDTTKYSTGVSITLTITVEQVD